MTLAPAMQIRSLQSHILAFFLLLMVVVQVGGFVLINTVGMTAARKSIGEDLVAGALVFAWPGSVLSVAREKGIEVDVGGSVPPLVPLVPGGGLPLRAHLVLVKERFIT